MRKVLYAKYNRTRKPDFQIATIIYQDGETRYVEKKALTESAKQHIGNLPEYAELLKANYPNFEVLPAEIIGDNASARFAYLSDAVCIENKITAELGNDEAVIEALKETMETMFEVRKTTTFSVTPEFTAVFGDGSLFEGNKAVPVANIDMITENLMRKDEKLICLDYEWVFDFAVPKSFLQYRQLYYFYNKYQDRIAMAKEDFFAAFGINGQQRNAFAAIETCFQEYVHGKDNEYRYTDHYMQRNEKFDEIAQNYMGLNYELSVKNKTIIDKERHIQNIEALLNDANSVLDSAKAVQAKWDHLTSYKPVKAVRWVYRKFKYRPEVIRVPQFDKPRVSIVIPVYNQFDYTYNCIKSIVNTVEGISYEIIIGDDMSTDATKHLDRLIKGVRVNVNPTDHGFLMNCNRAAKLAKGEFVLFLNNDTVVHPEWLSSLVELMDRDSSVGMCGSKLIFPNGRLQEAGGVLWSDGSGWNYGREQSPELPEFNYVREVDYISGASIMIRRSLWEEIGGFDERYKPAYCEDSDLAFEVRAHGFKVVYQPKSQVTHFEGVSNGTDLNSGLKQYQVENSAKLKEKWAAEFAKQFAPGQKPLLARERNRGSKTVLIIDHHMPTFDQDAGSKTTMQYIEMFLAKGYNVKFIADDFVQMEPYTTHLQQMGIETLYGNWYMNHIQEWLEANKDDIDFAYLNRPHVAEKYIEYLQNQTKIKVIFYGHDLHFLRLQRENELEYDENRAAEASMWKGKEINVMRQADISYYPSEVEIKAIHEIDPSIPAKAITAYVFRQFKENFGYDSKEKNGILFVGGFAHPPNADGVKWFLEEIFPKIREQAPIDFYIVGSHAPEEIVNLKTEGVIYKGFVSDEELADLYDQVRMVVVPLRYGAGVKGKVVEALYQGLPIVTTSVGAEGIPEIETVVSIADDGAAFAEAVVSLYQDENRLHDMAMATQDYIKKYFSVDAAWSVIEEDFT